MAQVVLGLGSNLGARRALFSCALRLLTGVPSLRVQARSRLYHTPPLGPPQPDYLNAALLVKWPHSLARLLAHTQRIEQLLRRTRAVHWGPRTLDIDILWSSEGELSQPGLHVPHRALRERNFALAPLLDAAPHLLADFADSLASAGGPPARSEPWQPLFTPPPHQAKRAAFALLAERSEENEIALTEPLDEPGELLSALAGALCSFAYTDDDGADDARSFELTGDRLALLGEGLLTQLQRAFWDGFHVREAAITELGEGALRGVLIGRSGPKEAQLPALTYAIGHEGGSYRATVKRAAQL